MEQLKNMLEKVEIARKRYINLVKQLTPEQGLFKPSPEEWSAAEITEHLVYAENGGICGMWEAIENTRSGITNWAGLNENEGLNIEEIINRTWKEKEQVPPLASPRMGGPLAFWIAAFENNQGLLNKLTIELEGMDLENIIQPHPISGPLNVIQRYQFLRFHIDRHFVQVERLMLHQNYPRTFERARKSAF